MRRERSNWIPLLAACLLSAGMAAERVLAEDKPHEFEAAIQKFEALDREKAPPERPILFVGSSSIRMWDVAKSFPDLPVLNRGFGGSQVADSVYFAERIVLKYHPRMIVFYAGDNDLASGKEPAEVAADFQAFVAKVRAALPETRIVFISIKPSLARWKLIDKARETNVLIAASVKSDRLVTFVNVEKPMLAADGKPRSDIFIADGLHMNAKGYELWTALVRPLVEKEK